MNNRRDNGFALLWGFAEATVFFIVPDVLLSRYALTGYRRGLLACLYALAGALAGGTVVWYCGRADADVLRALFESLPGIESAMIAEVRAELETTGVRALLLGPLQGIPYKLYALEASTLGPGLAGFLAISVPARLTRFLLVTLAAGYLARLLRRRLTLPIVQIIHLSFWCAFYLWYFRAMAAG